MSGEDRVWGQTADGRDSLLLLLENEFLRARVTDLGAALVSLESPDREGVRGNVVVGGDRFETYLRNTSYLGASVGRFANRIGRGRFSLNGKEYVLALNNGPNHLHGGLRGLTHRQWEVKTAENAVTFSTVSPDGEDGYPGTLQVAVTYRLQRQTLVIDYVATCDAPTIINLTNHTYWNLSGRGSILQHELVIDSDEYLENDADVLPTGRILKVADSAWDFREAHAIGRDIDRTAGGYDNCFVLRRWTGALERAAAVNDPASGRSLEVWTTEPGVQLYTANHFQGTAETGGANKFEAFCLECQHFPDAPNQPLFPSTQLLPGETYRQTTEHRFSVR